MLIKSRKHDNIFIQDKGRKTMKKGFLTSGAMIVGAAIALSAAGPYGPSIWDYENDPVWKQAQNEENYWAMVRRYNRK